MGLFNSSNPALNENTLREVTAVYGTEAMTLNGTIWKTVLGVALTFAGGLYAVYATLQNPASMQALLWVGLIGGLIAAMVTIFKPTVARFTMPIYAVLEGLVLGSASLAIPVYFGAPMAVVGQAILATVATFFIMLILYRSGVIKVTQKFVGVVTAATIGIAAVYLILFIMSRKFHKSLLPISYGIQQLCEGTAVDIHTKGVVKDLGDQLNQISRILERQRRDIARRDAARTEWIAGVSHDIRTPLSMILGYAENLTESENLSTEERRQAGVIRDESIRIRRLIEDLNLTSKLAYDMQPLRLKKYRPAVLLRRIVTEFLNKEYGDAFGFSLEIQKEVEQMELTGDVQLLERAVGNLIHNSIRHNPQGCAVFVSCRKEKNGIAVSLRDTGKGIPRTVRLCVLNGEQPPKDVHIMGLRIVKQITAAHKGSLSISEDGREVGLYLPEDFGTNL